MVATALSTVKAYSSTRAGSSQYHLLFRSNRYSFIRPEGDSAAFADLPLIPLAYYERVVGDPWRRVSQKARGTRNSYFRTLTEVARPSAPIALEPNDITWLTKECRRPQHHCLPYRTAAALLLFLPQADELKQYSQSLT